MHLSQDASNPADYRWPLLILRMFDLLSRQYIEWVLDVEGRTSLYINEDNTPTRLLLCLSDVLLAKGKPVTHFGICTERFQAPTHVLRRGYLFARMDSLETDDTDIAHFVAKTHPPIHLSDS